MARTPNVDTLRLRSVFVSDVHLGYRGACAESLCEFLSSVRVDYLFLVGDLVDLWSLKKSFFWPQAHSDVIRKILSKAKDGTKVIYIPGNHDELFREFDGAVFGNLEIHKEYLHTTADGRRLLLLHGDEFDGAVKCSPWLLKLGVHLYDSLLWVNHAMNRLRRRLGFAHWSLAATLKNAAKEAVRYMSNFEEAALAVARHRQVDGIVCGHIHRAALRESEGVLYCNDGDWVESCTSLIEDMNGSLAIVRWDELRQQRSVSLSTAATASAA